MTVSGLKNPPPARDYPNINALHGIRYFFDSTPIPTISGTQKPSSLLVNAKPVLVGTIPARSFIHGMTWHVAAPSVAGITLDVGTKANPTKWLALGSLATIARNDAAATTFGYVGDADTPVYATIRGVTAAGVEKDLENAIFSFLIYYYPKIGD